MWCIRTHFKQKCENAVYWINNLKHNIRLNVLLRWVFLRIVRSWEAWTDRKKGKSWCWGREVAGCCHPAVCCLNVLSGVNLLEELESSAGCHLFSTLSTLPLSTSLSLSVNREISAALVSVLQRHISPSQLKWFYEPLHLLQVYSWIKTIKHNTKYL